jgi:hypothetical protein
VELRFRGECLVEETGGGRGTLQNEELHNLCSPLETGGRGTLQNEELLNLCSPLIIIRMIKLRRMRCTGNEENICYWWES